MNWRYFGYLFWITARDTAAKPFLSLWSIKHKIFIADNISSRNVIWITVKEIDKFDRSLTHSEFAYFEIISSRARTICLYRSLTLLHVCPCDNQQVIAALSDESVSHMLVVIRKKYGDLVSYSEMFSIILKVNCLFQISKGIFLLNVQNITPVYGLPVYRMELHIDIFVELLFSHHSSHLYHQSIQMVFLICQYSIWQYFFNFVYNHFVFCWRDWLQR